MKLLSQFKSNLFALTATVSEIVGWLDIAVVIVAGAVFLFSINSMNNGLKEKAISPSDKESRVAMNKIIFGGLQMGLSVVVAIVYFTLLRGFLV
jgi:hypothetical protein